jgi:cob(I)alamin adenosyltransferase
MQRKKMHIDTRITEANINRGIVVLLTGNGKGKSSSALGMICRALGYNMQIGMVKFLKGQQATGEDLFLKQQKNVAMVWMQSGFTWESQNQVLDTKMALEAWELGRKFLQNPAIDLVVLDELTYMLNYKYLDESAILNAIKDRPKNQHVVITGRAANDKLKELADTLSEIKDIKHAFNQNIQAQKGIDY